MIEVSQPCQVEGREQEPGLHRNLEAMMASNRRVGMIGAKANGLPLELSSAHHKHFNLWILGQGMWK